MRFQADFGCDALADLRYVAVAHRSQKSACQRHALPAPVGHSLLDEKVGASAPCVGDLAAKAQVAQPLAFTDQLLIQPGRPDYAGLPLDGLTGFQ